jgi:glutaminyl-peptide cyclotransferase
VKNDDLNELCVTLNLCSSVLKKRMMNIKTKIFLLAACAALVSCQPEKPVTENTTTGEAVKTNTVVAKAHIVPPDFNADTAFAYIKTQADMGPRTPGSKAHDKAVAYYEKHFKNLGADVKVMGGNMNTFDGKQWRVDNVIATFNPAAKTRILLTAHYDSRPFADKDPIVANRTKACPGVNDGASGVGVLMEIARLIKDKPTNVGIDIILFDLEDYGDNGDQYSWCLGSAYWASNLHKANYKAKYAILLDMVGAKDAIFPREGESVFYANDVVNKIWNTAEKLGYSNYFIYEESGKMTDDHVPINEIAGIPAVDILHYNYIKNEFFSQHHTTNDDLSTIDKKTLKAVGQTLLEVIYNEEN